MNEDSLIIFDDVTQQREDEDLDEKIEQEYKKLFKKLEQQIEQYEVSLKEIEQFYTILQSNKSFDKQDLIKVSDHYNKQLKEKEELQLKYEAKKEEYEKHVVQLRNIRIERINVLGEEDNIRILEKHPELKEFFLEKQNRLDDIHFSNISKDLSE